MKHDKNSERKNHEECSCSEIDTQNSESDENGSEGWQTMQEEECCSCCGASESNHDEHRSSSNRDINGAEAGRYAENLDRCAYKDNKGNKCKPKARKTRNNTVGVVQEEYSRTGQGNATSSRNCWASERQGTSYHHKEQCTACDSPYKERDDSRNSRMVTCSCIGAEKKTRKKGSKTQRRKSKKEQRSAYCTCSSTANNQQCADCCTCLTYNRMPEQGQTATSNGLTVPNVCRRSGDRNAPEIRYNNASCQTCQNEDNQDGRQTVLLPRVSLRTSADTDDCEQCLRERVMFDRLSEQAVQSTIDETFRKLIRKTLEMFPAAQRTSQQTGNSFTSNGLIPNTDVLNMRLQPSHTMQSCTCTLKTDSQGETINERCCTECEEVPPDCTCEECRAYIQGDESCEECVQGDRGDNVCKLCVSNDETNESCEQCSTDSDDDGDRSDTCYECCKCCCWEKENPRKDDDFLF